MQMVVSVKNPIGAAGKAPGGATWEPAVGSAGCAELVGVATGVAWAGIAISRLLHVADERLGLVDGDVGVTDHQREVVGNGSGDEPLVAPVPRQADVMDGLAADGHRAHAPGHQRLGSDLGTRGDHPHYLGVGDALLSG